MVLLLAAVVIVPRWWVLTTSPSEGERSPVAVWGASRIGYDESLYTSGIRQAYDGEVPIRDAYFQNQDDAPPQPTALWQEAIALLAHATGGIFTSMALVTTLAAVAALLLLYTMAFEATGSRLAALAALPIALAGVQAFNQADGILTLRHSQILKDVLTANPARQLLAWTRYPAPIMVLAPFFAAAIAVPRAIESGSRRWIAAAAIALALLVYAYLYYWTAAAVAAAGLGAWLAYRRDWAALRRLLAVGALTALLSIPELFVLARNAADVPPGADQRVGLGGLGLDASLASTYLQRLLIAAPFIWALRRARIREQWFIALCLAPIAVGGFTGIVPQPWHYSTQVWGVFTIPAIVAGSAAFWRTLPKERLQLAGYALAGLAAICVVYGAVYQLRALRSVDSAYAITSDEDAAFAWARSNLGTNDTVATPSITTNLLLASLTPASEYIADGGFSKASDTELADRMLRVQAAFGYSDATLAERLNIDNDAKGFPLTDNTGSDAELERQFEDALAFFTFSFEIEHPAKFDERVAAWRTEYATLVSESNVLSPYPAGYLYCGHRERYFPAGQAAPGTFVNVAFQQGEVTIYKLASATDPGATAFKGCG